MIIHTAMARAGGAPGRQTGPMADREHPPGEAADSRLDRAVDELYAMDLDSFIPRRSELAKAAKGDGDRDAATAIGALRKPTRSAFAVNRLARTDPAAIDALVDLGTELQRAQTGGDGAVLRELAARRRELLDRLTRRAFDVVGQQSPSAGQREEVAATFTAALADTGVADQLRQGILVRAAESSGFGFSPPELTLIRSPQPVTAPDRPVPPEPTGPQGPAGPADRSGVGTPASDDETAATAATARKRADTAGDADSHAVRSRADAAREQEDREAAARERAVAAAQTAADAADAAVQAAVDRADAAQQLITRLQRELQTARRALEEAQKQTRAAEQKQKTARAALHKARR